MTANYPSAIRANPGYESYVFIKDTFWAYSWFDGDVDEDGNDDDDDDEKIITKRSTGWLLIPVVQWC